MGICVLIAHALFLLRLARPPSGPVTFAAKWCLLGLGSWALLSTGTVGLSAHLFCLTEIPFFGELAFFFRGFFGVTGLFYLFVLAILRGRVANQDSGDHRIGMMFVLTIFLSFPLVALFMVLSFAVLGLSVFDWPTLPTPCTGLVGVDRLGGTFSVLNNTFTADW